MHNYILLIFFLKKKFIKVILNFLTVITNMHINLLIIIVVEYVHEPKYPCYLNHGECGWEDHNEEEEELIHQMERDDIVLEM